MSDPTTPLVPDTRAGLADSLLRRGVSAAIRASLLVSPRPAALLARRLFATGGARTKQALDRHAPADVDVLANQRYGDHPDMLLDVVRPTPASGQLPLVLWVHGGGWVGGTKDELTGYFKLIASNGYTVAAPNYSLAPEHRYPTPLRQMMQALDYLQTNAARLNIDTSRIVLAGDSAGAHIAAQLGALVTTIGYADTVGVAPTITPPQLRGLILACGPYDLTLASQEGAPAGRRLIKAILWAYSGARHFATDPAAATWSVTEHVTSAFSPTLMTVGNADPLRSHSELLADRLRDHAVEPETLFFPADRQPPLGHEYQFELDDEAARVFLQHLLAFLQHHLAEEL